MNPFTKHRYSILPPCLALLVVLVLAATCAACPTCKDGLTHDPNSANLVRGYFYSIMFMLSAPYVIFGSLAAYFYWQIRKAKANQAWESGAEQAPTLPVS